MSRLDEFFCVARAMRDYQKRYFAGDKSVIGRAKAAEKRFDALLEALRPAEEAPGLFQHQEPDGS